MAQAIGKFIEGSGITKMMIDSELIAEGSIKGIINATHYNRCKKVHLVAALLFKKLHFNTFYEKYTEKNHINKLEEKQIIDILNSDSKKPDDVNLFLLDDVLRKYEMFTDQTLEGKHGYTAKYVMMYVRFIDYYLIFERAIRTSDLELYIYALYRMTPLFFTFNHQNYSRWTARYLDELINIDERYPGLRNELESGALSIRRTNANFCRTPVDLTLEQTVNANAANKLTGISSFTNSIYARQRWSETHITRTTLTAHLLDKLNLNKHDDFECNRKSKAFDRQQLKFTEEIVSNINPFCDLIDQSKLFNLTSGKSASSETSEFILAAEETGLQQMQSFIAESKSGERFFQSLKRIPSETLQQRLKANHRRKKISSPESNATY